jgi:YHS domain-containing protein
MKPLFFAFAFVLMTVAGISGAQAKDPIYTSSFSDEAVGGYDTVAYFTENKPVKGSEQFKTEHKGATWLFSSAENLEKFKADPDKYAPQYGGYCAYAVSQGGTASGDPQLWAIEGGKLYLNYSKGVQETWDEDRAGYITKADSNWPRVIGTN